MNPNTLNELRRLEAAFKSVAPTPYGVKEYLVEQAFHAALTLISLAGGTRTDEGVSCNGSWCAEQARVALEATP